MSGSTHEIDRVRSEDEAQRAAEGETAAEAFGLSRSGLSVEGRDLVHRAGDGKLTSRLALEDVGEIELVQRISTTAVALGAALGIGAVASRLAIDGPVSGWVLFGVLALASTFALLGAVGLFLRVESNGRVAHYLLAESSSECESFVLALRGVWKRGHD